MIPWNPCPPSRGIRAHLAVEFVPAIAWNSHPERFRHVFAESYGLPFKRFVLWRRLQTAAAALIDGDDATGAAHAAGFADSAHFTRTMKTMLGVQPSQFLRPR